MQHTYNKIHNCILLSMIQVIILKQINLESEVDVIFVKETSCYSLILT